ncbi:MAG TPA: diacylglycerol kinase family protein [Turneriella sp.]|nr:diacylglycerol kinase family protein [Turneriella sp.]HNL53013.1 diacylglycerol kinase family protein [Turneriella sp.]
MKSSKSSSHRANDGAHGAEHPPLGIITNPYAGKNASSSHRSKELQRLIGPYGAVRESRNLDQLKSILSEFAAHKVPYIVCDGGDGTIHWVINTYLEVLGTTKREAIEQQMPIFVPTNGGTIDFLAKKVGAHGGTFKILKTLNKLFAAGEVPRPVPLRTFLMEGKYTKEHLGKSYRKLAFSGALAGIAQKFFNKYYESHKPSLQTIVEVITKTFASTAFKGSLVEGYMPKDVINYSNEVFDPIAVDVKVDGKPVPFKRINTLNVGSIAIEIKNLIKLFSQADRDGKLHMHVGYLEPHEVFANLPNLFAGRDYTGKQLVQTTSETIEVHSRESEGLNPCLDGELFTGMASMKISVGPYIQFLGVKGE